MQITEDRRKQVIDLYFNQHKTYAEIAEIEHISPRDIHAIIKEEEARRQKYEHQQKQEEISSRAYKLFSQGKTPLQAAITLNIRQSEATEYCREYWRLRGSHKLNLIYKETNGRIWPFWKLYRELIKQRGMSIEQVVNVIDIAANRLPYMESLYGQVKEQVDNMQRTIQHLSNDVAVREYKILVLDKTVFSIEQECKRKEQQLQELTDKKERLEELIANNSNGEGYSKIKQIAKKNVKAALSENKQVISVAFTALLQTLKSDPQMINIIYKILTANDGEQQKDDNNDNASKYLESNKDSILEMTEKHYENLVEVLTNNAIDSAAASSSNPALSLPQSSSTFPNLSTQSDTYRREMSESFHNSKGDIVN